MGMHDCSRDDCLNGSLVRCALAGCLTSLCTPVAQGENAALLTEIDSASEAYETMQSSNTGLVRVLGERDAGISQMAGELLRHEQGTARCKADKDTAESACRLAQQHRQGLEQRLQELQLSLQVC